VEAAEPLVLLKTTLVKAEAAAEAYLLVGALLQIMFTLERVVRVVLQVLLVLLAVLAYIQLLPQAVVVLVLVMVRQPRLQ
jgi:hypothetical protein